MNYTKAENFYNAVVGWRHRCIVELPDNSYGVVVIWNEGDKVGKLITEDEHGNKS